MEHLSNHLVIRAILERHGFTFSKTLGQNFLVNSSVSPRMAGGVGTKGILEIGPGFGVLTHELAQVAEKVVAIELDDRLPAVLEETLAEHSNVKVISGDALNMDLRECIRKEFWDIGISEVGVCANLPYYITSPMIMKLLEERLPIVSITVMVQKEAAERLTAEPGTREVGAISLAVRYFSEPTMLFSVSRGSFYPSPNVDSAVIQLKLKHPTHLMLEQEKLLFLLIKSGFGQRRKTLVNALSNGTSFDKGEIVEGLKVLRLKETVRAEELTLEEFEQLALFLGRSSKVLPL